MIIVYHDLRQIAILFYPFSACIRRRLADYRIVSFNEAAAKACGGAQVSILDAAMIQRYAANYPSNPNIGKPM